MMSSSALQMMENVSDETNKYIFNNMKEQWWYNKNLNKKIKTLCRDCSVWDWPFLFWGGGLLAFLFWGGKVLPAFLFWDQFNFSLSQTFQYLLREEPNFGINFVLFFYFISYLGNGHFLILKGTWGSEIGLWTASYFTPHHIVVIHFGSPALIF